MKIAPFAETQRAGLIDLWLEAGLTRPWNDPDADINRALANATSQIFIANDESGIQGSVMVGDDGHRGWIYYLATSRTARGKGVGRLLMTAAENWLKDRGCPKIELMVRDTNQEALGFYDTLGYETQPVRVLARWLIVPEGGSPTAPADQLSGASKA